VQSIVFAKCHNCAWRSSYHSPRDGFRVRRIGIILSNDKFNARLSPPL
jgi:hypothetical protein